MIFGILKSRTDDTNASHRLLAGALFCKLGGAKEWRREVLFLHGWMPTELEELASESCSLSVQMLLLVSHDSVICGRRARGVG